jgi:hypothetical protein
MLHLHRMGCWWLKHSRMFPYIYSELLEQNNPLMEIEEK